MEEIIIAEEMAVKITDWPFLVVILGLGVTIGIYISSQIKCSIRKNIIRNNLKEYEEKKTKQ